MDMKNFYYRQKVLEADMDAIMDSAQDAIQAMAVDLDLAARTPTADKSKFGGIASGFTATFLSGFDIQITAGVAYDQLGQHIETESTYNVNVGYKGLTTTGQGGNPDGDAISIASGNEMYASIFILFDNKELDPRYDGYDDLVDFDLPESFQFRVEYGAEATAGSATPVARKDGEVLLCDVLCENTGGGEGVKSGGVDTDRKEIYIRLENVAYDYTITTTNIRDAIESLLDDIQDHIDGGTQHPAGDITWSSSAVWADGTAGATNNATDVDAALDGIVADLSAKYAAGGGVSGTARVGVEATSGASRPTLSSESNLHELSQTDLQTELEAIKDALNGRVFAGNDYGCGHLVPGSTLRTLGQNGDEWDTGFIDTLVLSTDAGDGVSTDINPTNNSTLDIGSTSYHWDNVFANAIMADVDDTYWHYVDIIADSASITSQPGLRILTKDDATLTQVQVIGNPNGMTANLEDGKGVIFGYGKCVAGGQTMPIIGTFSRVDDVANSGYSAVIGAVGGGYPMTYSEDQTSGNKSTLTLGGTSSCYYVPTETRWIWIDMMGGAPAATNDWLFYIGSGITDPTLGETRWESSGNSKLLFFETSDWPEDMTLSEISVDWQRSGTGSGTMYLYAARQQETWAGTKSLMALKTASNFVSHAVQGGRAVTDFTCDTANCANWSHGSRTSETAAMDKLVLVFLSSSDGGSAGDSVYGIRLKCTACRTVGKHNPTVTL